MPRLKLVLFCGIWLLFLPMFAATVSGFISRSGSGEPLQYVNVRVAETQAGMQTNKKGYFVINLNDPGEYTLELSLISYQALQHKFTISANDEDLQLNLS
ncbi:MAG: carboxypeptidase-like regulatory domain-containing protein, partial [Candidatus Cloacimonetes bacterium]|nr:carboxypeptidase-like regulatory domain-containing protein [Candidatus Cloacimonadota bacterium]